MPPIARIGAYKLSRTLGIGAFSKVKMGIHEPTKKKVAIKILNKQKLAQLNMGAKMRREIEILSKCNHPHIIRIYEVIDTEADLFVVMEYSPGGELFDYIVSHGRVAENDARRLFQQLIAGIDYCHSLMVVHRDLKPENLLLDELGNLKIADFGLSNIMRDGFFLATSCGSPNYAAPEVISGSLYAGPEVDIWSCGVILYALLCGNLPFDDDNIPSLFRKIKNGTYALPNSLSTDARDLISKLLAVDPLERITIAEIKAHPFFRQRLPRYLAVNLNDQFESNAKLHPVVVERLQQVIPEARRSDIVQSLQLCPGLITNDPSAETAAYRPIAVTYTILQGAVRKEEQSKQKHVDPSMQDDVLQDIVQTASFSPEALGNAIAPTQRQVWAFGIKTRGTPVQIMDRIYRTMRLLNLEWKLTAPYKLLVRPRRPSRLEFLLQVYTKEKTCILDLHRVAGATFTFFDTCHRMWIHLEQTV